jgi:hypothetical protein
MRPGYSYYDKQDKRKQDKGKTDQSDDEEKEPEAKQVSFFYLLISCSLVSDESLHCYSSKLLTVC